MPKDKKRSEAAKAGWAKRKNLDAGYSGYSMINPTAEDFQFTEWRSPSITLTEDYVAELKAKGLL